MNSPHSFFRRKFLNFALALGLAATVYGADGIKDTESASHGDEASIVTQIANYAYPGFEVRQFNLAVLSHYSYMLISDGNAIVIDPARDIDSYLETAELAKVPITAIILTHSHADFVAGHTEMTDKTGAKIYQSAGSGAGYPIHGVKDGETLEFGKAHITFLATPGHTPDGVCALVAAKDAPNKPLCMFSGDTLFVGSIGRPDLMGGTMAAATLAGMSFATWNDKLAKLPDEVVVLPAHGAGSLCGAHLRDEPMTTIGMERTSNPYLQHKGRGEFIAAVLDGLPDAPQYFKHNAAMNKQGPPLVDWKRHAPEPTILADLKDNEKFYVIDLRDAKLFAEGHIPNSVNIGLRGRLETWAGIMVPWGSTLAVCGSEEELAEAEKRLHRIAYKVSAAVRYEQWSAANLPVLQNRKILPLELDKLFTQGAAPIVVDVRLPAEWMGLRIGTVVNMPLNQLETLSSKLEPDQPVVTVCNSAYRSSLGIGILERRGFNRVMSLMGGTQAWIDAGLPVIQPTGPAQGAAAHPIRNLNLPDRISPEDLKRMIMDLPGTFELVDVRPGDHFEDYAIPQSKNVDMADLLNNPAYLAGNAPLVIVDRDGSLAMMAAGILSQKTKRPVKALYGGVENYWGVTEKLPAVRAVPLPAAATPRTGVPAPVSPATETRPKKKSAGC